MIEFLIPIIIIAILILANGFFVAAEFAIAGAQRPRVTQMAESGSAAAEHVVEILNDNALLNRYISTAQVGITLASLGLGMYGEHTVADWLIGPLEHLGWVGTATAHTAATIIAVGVLTYLHVVVGEMVPKSLALQSAAAAAVYLSGAMRIAEIVFRPLTTILNWIGDNLLRLAGMPPADAGARLVSTTELSYIFEESSESGFLEPAEQVFLENVIDFHERSVGQVMTPRTRIEALPIDADRSVTLDVVCESRHSRYPVFENDRDNIVGILHIKEIARHLLRTAETFDLSSLVRPAFFVPESLPLDEMLAQFRSQHFQIAIVLDEYGGTAGLVTLEDLAEELIGEIQDEFDEEIDPVEDIDENTLRVRGDLLLAELTQHYDLDFEEETSETVGGMIMARLGHVARVGNTIVDERGLSLTVESMDGLAIRTAIVGLPEKRSDDQNVEDLDTS